MSNALTTAPEAQSIVKKVVVNWRADLDNADIRCIFGEEAQVVRGADRLATANKWGGLKSAVIDLFGANEPASEGKVFFLLQFWKEGWDNLDDEQRIAIVDEVLAHCQVERTKGGAERYRIVPPDVEGFFAVAQRHGACFPNVEAFIRAIEDRRDNPSLLPLSEVVDTATPKKGRGRPKEALTVVNGDTHVQGA